MDLKPREGLKEMKQKTALMLLILTFSLNLTAHADDYPSSAGRKLGRGLANTAFGWTEVLKSQENISDDYGIAAGVLWGTLDGLGNTVKRTAAGIFETVTFPITTVRDNSPLLGPEFPLSNDRAGERPKDYTF